LKIVVTGMGAVSAAGSGVARFVHASDGWRVALAPDRRFVPAGLPVYDLGVVPDDALAGEPNDDRAVRLALPACVEALRSAAIRPGDTARRVDLFFVGTSLGGMATAQALQRLSLDTSATAPAAAAGTSSTPWTQAGYHGPAATLAARLHLRAQVATYNATCSSGLVALLLATERIRRGEARLAVVGAVDALTPFVYAGFHALGAMASGRCAPYDTGSTGLTLAEGAAFLVVESEESAEERDAPKIAEVTGVASTNDAHHLISPHPEGRGVVGALEEALKEAALPASQLSLVVGHGVGTPQADFAELRALAQVLGGERTISDRVPLTSWKGALGHPLAASGLLSVIRAIAALKHRRVPPVVGMRHPVATFPVRLPKEPEPIASNHAAVLAAGLGGQASAAVLRLMSSPTPRGDAASSTADLAPARPRAPRAATRPLRMIRDEVVIVGAAVASSGDLAGVSLAEFERLNPIMSLRHLPEEGQLAYLAVKGAMREAGELLPPSGDVALVAGVGHESLAVCARFAKPLHDAALAAGASGGGGSAALGSPALFAYTAANAIPAAVAASFGFRGPSATASSGSFASAQALLDAALLLAEGRARRAVVFAFAPTSDELDAALRRGGFLPKSGTSEPRPDERPIAAALVLARVDEATEPGARTVRLELRRRKRSSVTAPTVVPELEPLLGAESLVRVAQLAARIRSGGAASSLRALDPCTGAALWLQVKTVKS
jgi:3-oxoacyl-[acyl-carrier-protein] synthase II